jgi:hypothetical protein
MPHLPPAHHETSKHDSPNETKIKEKQNKTKLSQIRIQTLPSQWLITIKPRNWPLGFSFDQALWSWSNRVRHAKGNLWLAKSWFHGPYFPASVASGSIDLASYGNRRTYPNENREFFRACGLWYSRMASQEWVVFNDRHPSWVPPEPRLMLQLGS